MTDTFNQELAKMDDHLQTKARLTKAETLLRQLYAEHTSLRDRLFESQADLTRHEGALRFEAEQQDVLRKQNDELQIEIDRLTEAYSRIEDRLASSAARHIAKDHLTESLIATTSKHYAALTRIPRFIRRIFHADFTQEISNAHSPLGPNPRQGDDRRGSAGGERGAHGPTLRRGVGPGAAPNAGEGGVQSQLDLPDQRLHDSAREE